jgi:hypothetical protein
MNNYNRLYGIIPLTAFGIVYAVQREGSNRGLASSFFNLRRESGNRE